MKNKSWLWILSIAVLALSCLPARAMAVTTWSFSFIGGFENSFTATGQFTTSGDGSTPEPILSISGSYRDPLVFGAITGLAPVPVPGDSYFFYDNILSPTQPYFDADGVVFFVGSSNVNLSFADGAYLVDDHLNSETDLTGEVSLTVTKLGTVSSVPEPAQRSLMLLAALGLAGLLAHRALRSARGS